MIPNKELGAQKLEISKRIHNFFSNQADIQAKVPINQEIISTKSG